MREEQRVDLGRKGLGTIRFVGLVETLPLGWWVGVELDEANGKHDGEVKGKRLFACESSHGVVVRPHRVHFVDPEDEAELSSLRRDIEDEALRADIKEEPHRKAYREASEAAQALFLLSMMNEGHPRGF